MQDRSGGGGHSSTSFYSWKFDKQLLDKYSTIHRLEAINLLIAYKTLAPQHHNRNLTVILLTDNMASSHALSSGKSKDAVLAACSRQMWLEAACRGQTFIIRHKPGIDIPLADALSRSYDDPAKARFVRDETTRRGLSRVKPILDGYAFFDSAL